MTVKNASQLRASEGRRRIYDAPKEDVRAALRQVMKVFPSPEWTVLEDTEGIEALRDSTLSHFSMKAYILSGPTEAQTEVVALYREPIGSSSGGRKLEAMVLDQLPVQIEYVQLKKAGEPKAAVTAAGLSPEDLANLAKAITAQTAKPTAPAEPKLSSDVDTPVYRSAEQAENFALVIGIENYADLPSAQYAARDATAVKRHLMSLGYPERNIVSLTDSQATKSGLQKNIEVWLPKNVTELSTVFFYYSGHGAPDIGSGKAYLLPVDGDPAYLEVTGYPIQRLYAKLSALKAKRVFVAVDSCFSGAGGRSILAKGTRPLVTKVDIGKVPSEKIVSFSASEAEQVSGTIEEQGHGLFTYYLLKGLNGAAQIKGGQVTAKSLYDYLKPEVQNAARRQNRDQTPMLRTSSDVVIRLR